MNIAVDNDWIQTNPVGRYKKVTQKVERDFLTEEDMKAITGLENLKINQSIVQVNDMSRQTAEAMAEAARAVSDLAAQAQGLTNLIQELKQA